MNAGMPRFSVYLLDFDGTIAATRPAGIKCLARTLSEYGATVPEEQISAAIGRGELIELAVARLIPGLAAADIPGFVLRYRELYPDIDRELTHLFDGARETITDLHRDGCKIVVLSNKGRAALDTVLDRFDLRDQTSAVIAADPGLPVKPDPQVFHQRVLPLFSGLARSDFVMVGDTTADIAFAQAAGIASCWASYGYGDAGACLAMEPDFVVDALSDLLAIGAGPA